MKRAILLAAFAALAIGVTSCGIVSNSTSSAASSAAKSSIEQSTNIESMISNLSTKVASYVSLANKVASGDKSVFTDAANQLTEIETASSQLTKLKSKMNPSQLSHFMSILSDFSTARALIKNAATN